MFQFDVITLFPQMFDAVTQCGVTGRGRERGVYKLNLWNPRDFTTNSYRTVDDRPYGGGPGMVMLAEPLAKELNVPVLALSQLSRAVKQCSDKRRGKRRASHGGIRVLGAGGRKIRAGRGKHDLRSARRLDQYVIVRVDCRDADDMWIRGGIQRRRGRPIVAHRGDDDVAAIDQIADHSFQHGILRTDQTDIDDGDLLLAGGVAATLAWLEAAFA